MVHNCFSYRLGQRERGGEQRGVGGDLQWLRRQLQRIWKELQWVWIWAKAEEKDQEDASKEKEASCLRQVNARRRRRRWRSSSLRSEQMLPASPASPSPVVNHTGVPPWSARVISSNKQGRKCAATIIFSICLKRFYFCFSFESNKKGFKDCICRYLCFGSPLCRTQRSIFFILFTKLKGKLRCKHLNQSSSMLIKHVYFYLPQFFCHYILKYHGSNP